MQLVERQRGAGVVSSSADTKPVAVTGVACKILQATSNDIFCNASRFAAGSWVSSPCGAPRYWRIETASGKRT